MKPGSDEVYKISAHGADGALESKNIRFNEVSEWGLPENFKGKVYEMSVTVKDAEEGKALFKEIVKNGPAEWQETSLPDLEGRSGFGLGNKLYASIESPSNGVGERPHELKVRFPREGDGPAEAKHLLQALNKMGLQHDSTALQTMDLSTVGAKAEWAKYSFKSWAKSLSQEESRALNDLGTGDYRSIHRYLRSSEKKSAPSIDATVKAADSAIAKGHVDRTITTYRSDSSPELHELWEKMAKEGAPKNGVPLKADPAYTFTSINRDVAKWWNSYDLKGKGVLLEIEVPKNSSAAYIDSQGIHQERGYLELVLPRNSKFEATGFSQTPDGQKVLKVRLKP